MKNAVEDTRALVVTSQPQMLEKLEHSEVSKNYKMFYYQLSFLSLFDTFLTQELYHDAFLCRGCWMTSKEVSMSIWKRNVCFSQGKPSMRSFMHIVVPVFLFCIDYLSYAKSSSDIISI